MLQEETDMSSCIFLFDPLQGRIMIEKIDPELFPDLESEIRNTIRSYERLKK